MNELLSLRTSPCPRCEPDCPSCIDKGGRAFAVVHTKTRQACIVCDRCFRVYFVQRFKVRLCRS